MQYSWNIEPGAITVPIIPKPVKPCVCRSCGAGAFAGAKCQFCGKDT